ncbi:MAG: OPT/YSL family transporter, partial [Acidobacteriota bacterium]|nr:OPT/YSL family transporter [Acidobacteriota bacterium]
VIVSSLVMWIPLFILNASDLKMAALKGYKGGFGGEILAAPQAGLMAKLSQGIVGGEMVWPLIVVGILMAVAFILVQVKSPMLVCVGMYLSFETTAAIFVGGIIRWVVDTLIARRKHNDNQKSRIENRGVLLASGLIAGEALVGLVFAAINFAREEGAPNLGLNLFGIQQPNFLISIVIFFALGYMLVKLPLGAAGDPDEPAAPAVM